MRDNIARDHHYLPQFYLREFCNDEGLVTRTFKGADGKLYERAFTPRKVGYQRDLYSIRDAGPGFSVTRTDIIETNFFKTIDNDAAVALKVLIEQGPNGLTLPQRERWAMFVSSLLQRHPRYVNEHDLRARQLVQEVIDEFAASWGPPPPGRRDILASLNIERVARYSSRAQLAKAIREPRLVKYLSELFAVTITVPADSPVKFVTGENPVVVNLGHSGPINCLTLALSPTVLLFCEKERTGDDDPVRELVLVHNPLVIKQCEFVFSQEPLTDGMPLRVRKCAQDALSEVSAWPRNQGRPTGGSSDSGSFAAQAPSSADD